MVEMLFIALSWMVMWIATGRGIMLASGQFNEDKQINNFDRGFGVVMGAIWPVTLPLTGLVFVLTAHARMKAMNEIMSQSAIEKKREAEFSVSEVRRINTAYEEALRVGPNAPDSVALVAEVADLREALDHARAAHKATQSALERSLAAKKAAQEDAAVAGERRWLAPDSILPTTVPLGARLPTPNQDAVDIRDWEAREQARLADRQREKAYESQRKGYYKNEYGYSKNKF